MIAVLLIALAWVWNANAGDPAGPQTPPESTNSYTIEDVYQRLNEGTDGWQAASKKRNGHACPTPRLSINM